MSTAVLAGIGIAAAAMAGRACIMAIHSLKSGPQKFYKGGFQSEMTRREAALILGLRESATEDKVKEAHKRIMLANHPDAGGSGYLAAKVNEAKEMLLGKKKNKSSAL